MEIAISKTHIIVGIWFYVLIQNYYSAGVYTIRALGLEVKMTDYKIGIAILYVLLFLILIAISQEIWKKITNREECLILLRALMFLHIVSIARSYLSIFMLISIPHYLFEEAKTKFPGYSNTNESRQRTHEVTRSEQKEKAANVTPRRVLAYLCDVLQKEIITRENNFVESSKVPEQLKTSVSPKLSGLLQTTELPKSPGFSANQRQLEKSATRNTQNNDQPTMTTHQASEQPRKSIRVEDLAVDMKESKRKKNK
jgi:hypothetical protein